MVAWWLHSMICKLWPAPVLGTCGAPATVAGKCVGGKRAFSQQGLGLHVQEHTSKPLLALHFVLRRGKLSYVSESLSASPASDAL